MSSGPPISHHRFSLGETVRWALFRLLEFLSNLRGDDAADTVVSTDDGSPEESLWVFVSTIGELNAIAPIMKRLVESFPGLKLVLISDHQHYRDAYLSQYPAAFFFQTIGNSLDARRLCKAFPPRLLLIGEIPCRPSDAPCRFSYAFVRQARKNKALVAIVNGWLYGGLPSCRIDYLERKLLERDFLRAIDVACVQTKETKNILTAAGAPGNRIHVTGNMKFDALENSDWSPERCKSPVLLRNLIEAHRPSLVVGCIRNLPEQTLVIDAFAEVRKHQPIALMVFAHRHPEIAGNIEMVSDELNQKGLVSVRRSESGDTPPGAEIDCLILDTMGELRDFYAAATIAHVGADHNLLEPIAFGKPVTTVSTWHREYPNYPIFDSLQRTGGVVTLDSVETLAAQWIKWVEDESLRRQQHDLLIETLKSSRGATAKAATLLGLE